MHPLVVILPPDHIGATAFVQQTRFDKLADEHGFVVIAPSPGQVAAWSAPSHIALVPEVVSETRDSLCIDGERIYLLGHANSGKAVEELTCESWVAAAAASSYRSNAKAFRCAGPPIPFLLLAPTKTGHLPLEGGVNCYGSQRISHADEIRRWKRRNSCGGPSQTTFEHEGSTCKTWTCDVPFTHCELDGGYGWPGSPARNPVDWKACDGEPPKFPSEDVVWEFFAANPRTNPR